MKMYEIVKFVLILLLVSNVSFAGETVSEESEKTIYYIADNLHIPFWRIMSEGIKNRAAPLGYDTKIHSSDHSKKRELELVVKAIKDKADGIIVSPSNSTSCVTLLKLAEKAEIPVVISDIGSDSGEYVSYISSDNWNGAYSIGKYLASKKINSGYENGRVGIIAIPQKRINGKERTLGFRKALQEHNIKGADIRQLEAWNDKETYGFTNDMIEKFKDLRAVWIQTSNPYKGVLKALQDAGKEDEILFVAFDAEPEFLDLIPENKIMATGMQQPYLMGQKAMNAMNDHLSGKEVKKDIQVPILIISSENIQQNLPKIKINVLGIQ